MYVGAHCMIIDNNDISKGCANGSLCRVICIKRNILKPLEWKNYDSRKVYTTIVNDIEYVEFEHFPKKIEQVKLENKIADLTEVLERDPLNDDTQRTLDDLQWKLRGFVASRRFQLKPKRYYCTFFRSDLILQTRVSKHLKYKKG